MPSRDPGEEHGNALSRPPPASTAPGGLGPGGGSGAPPHPGTPRTIDGSSIARWDGKGPGVDQLNRPIGSQQHLLRAQGSMHEAGPVQGTEGVCETDPRLSAPPATEAADPVPTTHRGSE